MRKYHRIVIISFIHPDCRSFSTPFFLPLSPDHSKEVIVLNFVFSYRSLGSNLLHKLYNYTSLSTKSTIENGLTFILLARHQTTNPTPTVISTSREKIRMVSQRGVEALQKVSLIQYAPKRGSKVQQERPPRHVVYSQKVVKEDIQLCFIIIYIMIRGEMEGRDFLRNFLTLHGMEMDQREEEGVQGEGRDEEIEQNVSGYFQSALQQDEGEIKKNYEKTKVIRHGEQSSSSSDIPTSAKDIGLTLLKLLFVVLVVTFLTVRLFAPKHEERLSFVGGFDFINKK